ncbi:MAG TPA: hypothetical protein VF323_14585 [Candidatus Limnocylindrales bacterium]
MARVIVRILHLEPGPTAGPLERLLADARRAVGERHVAGFRAAGADDVRLVSGPPDDTPFGARLRAIVADARPGPAGIVVLGAGSLTLATLADRRAFVEAAAGPARSALANNRYSADAVAIALADELPAVPDLPGDNALPRWIEEVAGWSVADLRARWRLQVDLDSPLDVELTRPGALPHDVGGTVRERLAAARRVAADRRAELVVAGRTSAATLRWLERSTACRVRALVEERGLRASARVALADGSGAPGRPPRSVLGTLLDRDGPEALGARLAELGDAAVIDTRVLLAHRLGVDESSWPSPEDRFASDLLLPDRVHDPWLRAITRAAVEGPIPILLGGHTLVGPGLRLALRPRR